MITYYELRYSIDRGPVKTFITLQKEELKIKTSEVLDSAETVVIHTNTLQDTEENFLKRLRGLAKCI